MSKIILVAEDSPTELRLVINLLSKKGYTTITASDGEEALEKAKAEHPKLAIIDIIMPKMNGFQLTRQLKNEPTTKGIKVLLLSSKNQESDKFWGFKQGADEYLTKPFDEKTLIAAVEKLM
jgi:DNA-binding response OmpR family regulator